MSIELVPEDMPDSSTFFDACPECGHPWPEGVPEHYHDCRYYRVSSDEDDAEITSLPTGN